MNKSKIILAMLALSVNAGVFYCHANGPNTNLPYADNFEAYANFTPLVGGIGGWYADSARAVVQTNTVQSGSKAAIIPTEVTLSNRFANMPITNVWLQMYVAPVRYDWDETPTVSSNAAAMFYVNTDGYFTVHNAAAPTTNWIVITNAITGEEVSPVSNQWVRLDLYHDYSQQKWTMFADYILLMENIHFFNTNNTSFSGFELYNGSFIDAFLDNIAVTVSNPADLGADGGNWLPTLNVNETNFTSLIDQGENADAQSFEIWKTGGYYALTYTNTVTYDNPDYSGWLQLNTWSGTSAGEHHTVTVNYLTASLPSRTQPYKATIRIDAYDARFGFTAKHSGWTIHVEVKVVANMDLAVSPASLSQMVDQGSNPTNQAFLVWNDSPPPPCRMDFSLAENISWLSLSAYSGGSTGDQQEIGVMFADMSGMDAGTYTGTIAIKGWGDTGVGGIQTQAESVAVSVTIEGPPPPPSLIASDGTDTEMVIVTWGSAPGISRYEVWRGDTFDLDYALKIAEVTTTNYNDMTASPGLLYYYWVKSVSDYGVLGDASDSDTGYRGLASPGGLFASAGTYTNRVRVTWSASTGADSYELHRGIVGQSLVNVFHARGLSYDDSQVHAGVKYTYRVRAKNSRYFSELSQADIGYVLSPPTTLHATHGTVEGKVLLTWSAADSATAYEVWRSDVNLPIRASLLGKTTDTEYTDSEVTAGAVYYYWVKSKNSTATSGFSPSASGYSASGSVDMSVQNLVILPGTIAVGASPSVVSFRMSNKSGRAIESPNTAVKISFYASIDPSFEGEEPLIGQMTKDISLLPGGTLAMTVAATNVVMPAVEGDYYVFVQVEPVYPSTLMDDNLNNNMTMRAAPVRVDAVGGQPHRAINDYDGDGIADLAVVCNGHWYICSADGMAIATDVLWGGPGFTTTVGDYDGDGIADIAVYALGMWFVRNVSGDDVILYGEMWGGSEFDPVYGAFSGASESAIDLAVYNRQNGAWYVRDAEGRIVLWEAYFGDSGYLPVPGDFDGDGIWDIAVYHQSTGAWYIRTVSGALLLWGGYLGGSGFDPVVGDYDGDGAWDLALYYQPAGLWFICTLSGDPIMWGGALGGPGFVPVPGDYTGDGCYDFAVYHEQSGTWYIVSNRGELVLWGGFFGGPGYKPVGK